jgi:outer membrane protein OmpA-like peptidoglycan-associated protein
MKGFYLSIILLAFALSGADSGQSKAVLPFVLNLSPDGDGAVLQGSIPSPEQKEAIYEAAVKALGGGKVENHLKLSVQTVSEAWIDELPDLITRFLEFSPGDADFSVVDGKIILQGEIGDRKKYENLRREIYGEAPKGLVFEDRLTVKGVRMVPPKEVPEESVEVDLEQVASAPAKTKAPAPEMPSLSKAPKPVAAKTPKSEKELTYLGPLPVEEVKSAPPVISAAKTTKPVAMREAKSAEAPKVEADPEPKTVVAKLETPKPVPGPETKAKPPTKKLVEEEMPEKKSLEVADHGSDPGGPLLFYFETGSAEIRAEDRHQIEWAIERCKRARTILYVTGYADYRGSYSLNRALTIQRTENVRDAIFEGDVADDLKAELEAKGDAQSESRDAWKSQDSEAALQYSRRVVVETYHLK